MDDSALRRQRRLTLLRGKRPRLERGECSSSAGTVSRPSNSQNDLVEHNVSGQVAAVEVFSVGLPEYRCRYCRAFFWFRERCKATSRVNDPRYSGCCRQGRVSLPVLKEPPSLLNNLLDVHGGIRSFNF